MALSKSDAGKLGYAKSLQGWAQRQHEVAAATYLLAPKVCRFCNKPLPYEDRRKDFCGSSCAASHNNQQRGPRGKGPCRVCGQPIPHKQHFCSMCWPQARHRVTLEQARTDGTRRRILIRERGHRCEKCGATEWQGVPVPLQLDHIDGNSDHNDGSNLRLLCPNCHALTPTFAGANLNNTHSVRNTKRRSRYHASVAQG